MKGYVMKDINDGQYFVAPNDDGYFTTTNIEEAQFFLEEDFCELIKISVQSGLQLVSVNRTTTLMESNE